MFDIGGGELLLLAGVAVIVMDPRKLPNYLQEATKAFKQVKQVSNSIKDTVKKDKDFQSISKEFKEMKGSVTGDKGDFTDLPEGLKNEHMVCLPEEEWQAAIDAYDREEKEERKKNTA